MKILYSYGKEELARVFVADFGRERYVEFVESLQPPIPRERKWVLIVSTSAGCPIRCKMCDAGGDFQGNLTAEEIFAQIDYLVDQRFPDRSVPVNKFKIQFARMGEPALNSAVLEVLEELTRRYQAPGLMPCISTIAPRTSKNFIEHLVAIKNKLYSSGNFQMQLSIHSTDEKERDRLMPIPKLTLNEIAEFGSRFYKDGDRKITLNFALARQSPFDVQLLSETFSAERFMFKITPLNPTYSAQQARLTSYIDAYDLTKQYAKLNELSKLGYDVLISIGENEENLIGSNCGQFVQRHLSETEKLQNSYTYVK